MINRQVLRAKNDWEATFDSIPDPIAIIDKNYNILRVNQSMADRLGLRPQDCINKKCYKYLHGLEAPPAFCQYAKLLRDGKNYTMELHEEGLGGDFLLSAAPFYEDGELKGSVHILRDITQSKHLENELRRKEARNRLILEAVGEGIYGLDRQGNTDFINQAASKMLGYTAEEIIGRHCHGIIHHTRPDGEPYPEEQCLISSAMRQNKVFKVSDEVLWRKDGSSFPVEYTSTPVHDNGEVTGCVVVFHDITERKKTEAERLAITDRQQQIKKFKSLNVLAGGIAHNFNNILTAVLGNIELLLYRLPESSSKEREFAEAAMHSARRAADLSTMMLWYVGQGKIERQVLDLRDIAKELDTWFTPSDLQGCRLKIVPCEDPVMFEGDGALVRQIILNLVNNAIEAMSDQKGEVQLSLGRRKLREGELGGAYLGGNLPAGEYVYLEVSDHGIGMSKECLEHIFEPFYSTKFTGRGLGLPTTLGIMRSHRGGIVLNSKLGRGTTASVLFPAASVPEPIALEPGKVDAGSFQGLVVLFVEDDEVLRECNREILQLLGLEVLIAADGLEALEVYKEHKEQIALVLLDIGLPKLDGIQTLARLKEINPEVKVIIQTGYQAEVVTDKFPPEDVAGFIQKPFAMHDLRIVLDKTLTSRDLSTSK